MGVPKIGKKVRHIEQPGAKGTVLGYASIPNEPLPRIIIKISDDVLVKIGDAKFLGMHILGSLRWWEEET